MNRFIILLLTISLLLVLPRQLVKAQDGTDNPYYFVQGGDTLSLIAARFGVSIQDLIEVNDIDDPNLLPEGTRLEIPGFDGITGELILHTVTLGENYSRLSQKNNLEPRLLSRLNRMTSPEEIVVGSRIILPKKEPDEQLILMAQLQREQTVLDLATASNKNPWEIYLENLKYNKKFVLPGDLLFTQTGEFLEDQIAPDLLSLEIDPLPFSQGNTVEIKVKTSTPMEIQADVAGYHPQFFRIGENEYVALQGIHAREEIGITSIHLLGVRDGKDVFSIEQKILIESGYFGQDPPIYVDPITIQPEVVEPEQEIVEKIVSQISQEKLWDGLFQYPVDEPCLSAYYGGSRVYNDTYHYYHTGIDFNVCRASNINIYSVAPGYVVFAGPLVVRGNAVIVDHGWGVFSGYWHQSEILVSEGDYLETGQLIGYIGNTGRSTGAHLHLEIWVNGVQVDPFSWLQREYPN